MRTKIVIRTLCGSREINVKRAWSRTKPIRGLLPVIEVFKKEEDIFLYKIVLENVEPRIICSIFGKTIYTDPGGLKLEINHLMLLNEKLGISINGFKVECFFDIKSAV